MTSTEAFLGVARSVTNARWQAAQTRLDGANLDRAAAAIAEHFPDMPLPVTRILAGQDTEDMPFEHYLDPKLRDLLPNPSRFKDMDRAATRLADAVEAGTPIGVFGDYDVDGAAAAALLVNILGALGLAVDVHIPDSPIKRFQLEEPELWKKIRAHPRNLPQKLLLLARWTLSL